MLYTVYYQGTTIGSFTSKTNDHHNAKDAFRMIDLTCQIQKKVSITYHIVDSNDNIRNYNAMKKSTKGKIYVTSV